MGDSTELQRLEGVAGGFMIGVLGMSQRCLRRFAGVSGEFQEDLEGFALWRVSGAFHGWSMAS